MAGSATIRRALRRVLRKSGSPAPSGKDPSSAKVTGDRRRRVQEGSPNNSVGLMRAVQPIRNNSADLLNAVPIGPASSGAYLIEAKLVLPPATKVD